MYVEGNPQPEIDPQVKKDLAARIGPVRQNIRSRRRPLEQVWLNNHGAWKAVRMPGRAFFQSETFNYYLPAARRAIERIVTRARKILLPSSEFFEVYPGDEQDTQAGLRADSVRAYMTWLMRRKLDIHTLVGKILRSFLIYNRAIVKTGVKLTQAPVQWGGVKGQFDEVWPTARTVDAFSFYVWPETVTDIDDATLVFEDVMLPFADYAEMAARGVCDPIDPQELGTPEWPHYHRSRLAQAGISDPSNVSQASIDVPVAPTGGSQMTDAQKFVALTEAWFRAGGRLMQMFLVWNVPDHPHCTRLDPSPLPRSPYRMALARPLEGEHYTSGVMDDLEPFNVLLNDQVNQGEEARAIASVPPIAIDPNKVGRGDSFVLGYRRRWLLQDPKNAMAVPELPNTTAEALKAQAATMSQINAMGAAGPMTEGLPTRGLPRGTAAVGQLMSAAMADVTDIAEIVEHQILTPMLHDLHRLTVQFVPRDQVVRIPGTGYYPARAIDVRELDGNWDLVWVGSQQAQDLQARAQKMIAVAGQLVKIAPLLTQQGYILNLPLLLKRMWRDGLGERGVEQIIYPMPPEMMQLMAGQQAGMPPGGGQPGPPPGAPANPQQAAVQEGRPQESIVGRMLSGAP